MPAEYVLLALAASNAAYCCSPAAVNTTQENNTTRARIIMLSHWQGPSFTSRSNDKTFSKRVAMRSDAPRQNQMMIRACEGQAGACQQKSMLRATSLRSAQPGTRTLSKAASVRSERKHRHRPCMMCALRSSRFIHSVQQAALGRRGGHASKPRAMAHASLGRLRCTFFCRSALRLPIAGTSDDKAFRRRAEDIVARFVWACEGV